MKIGLRVLLGYFLIVALAALLVGRVFLEQVKPGVRQAMEGTLIDTANTLAELATDDLLAGRIADGAFARRVRAVQQRHVGAEVWGLAKDRSGFRVTEKAGCSPAHSSARTGPWRRANGRGCGTRPSL